MPPASIRRVHTAAELNEVRTLFSEYRAWLVDHSIAAGVEKKIVEVGTERLSHEIQTLPGEYAPPSGALLLALEGKFALGCAAIRRVDASSAELKRLYVRPSFRGRQVGEALTRASLETASQLGYERVVLDTMPTMEAAITLYRKMGFVSIPAYWPNPLLGALFFEYLLRM